MRDYFEMWSATKQFNGSKNGYCYDDVLNWYGYSKILDEFYVNVSKHKEQAVLINSTDEISNSSDIIFCVDILDQHFSRGAGHRLGRRTCYRENITHPDDCLSHCETSLKK